VPSLPEKQGRKAEGVEEESVLGWRWVGVGFAERFAASTHGFGFSRGAGRWG
jgi:hypothetical protein